MIGTIAQCRLDFLRTIRDKYFFMSALLWPLLFYFIYTIVFHVESIGTYKNIQWDAFFLMSMTAFSVLTSSLNGLGFRFAVEREIGWAKRLSLTPLSKLSYIISKIFSQMLLNFLIIIAVFLAGGVLNGVSISIDMWIQCMLWLWLGSLPFMGLGVLIGTARNPLLIQSLSSFLYLGLSILGGLWMPLESLPKMIQMIGVWLPSFRYGEGAWRILSHQTPSILDTGILIFYFIIFVVLSIYSLVKQEEV